MWPLQFMQGLKSAILANFWNGPEWLCPAIAAIKNPSQESKKYFCFGFLAGLEGKIGEAPFFKVQTGKITVCLERPLDF